MNRRLAILIAVCFGLLGLGTKVYADDTIYELVGNIAMTVVVIATIVIAARSRQGPPRVSDE